MFCVRENRRNELVEGGHRHRTLFLLGIYGGAAPKESQLENEGIARGTIYIGIEFVQNIPFS